MKNAGKILLRIGLGILLTALMVVTVFLAGRYGWKLFGFRACSGAGIESVEVTDHAVTIRGYSPGFFGKGFLGYHAEERDGVLYIGFRFSGLFGIFETGQFDITVPTENRIEQVIIKTKHTEYPIWP